MLPTSSKTFSSEKKNMLSQRWVLNYSINVLQTPIHFILCGKISDSLASNLSRKLKPYRYRTLFPLGQITHKSVAKDMCSGVINSETRLIYIRKFQFHQLLLNLGLMDFSCTFKIIIFNCLNIAIHSSLHFSNINPRFDKFD